MRLMPLVPTSKIPARGVLAHDVRDPTHPGAILARKGNLLDAAELATLLARGVHEAHLLLPDEGDLVEDEAASRLAASVVGFGVESDTAHYGQVMFRAAQRGLVRIHETALDDVNRQPGVLLFTGEPNCPVDVGTPLGGIKCAPLLLSLEIVQAVAALGQQYGPVIEVAPFRPARVAFLAPAARLRGNAFAQARRSLSTRLAWYGSTLDHVVTTRASSSDVGRGFRAAAQPGIDLVLAAGASATDPADLLFDGLRHAGGQVEQVGVPAEPGTACWIGHLGETPVLGLASCELYGKPGALDLLLPRLLAGQPLDARLLRGLALGGLVVGGPSRVAPYDERVE